MQVVQRVDWVWASEMLAVFRSLGRSDGDGKFDEVDVAGQQRGDARGVVGDRLHR
jgi:hypothetical protein